MAFECPIFILLGSQKKPSALRCNLQKQNRETTHRSVKPYNFEQSLPSRAVGLSQCTGGNSLHRSFSLLALTAHRCPLSADILLFLGVIQGAEDAGCSVVGCQVGP